MNKDHIIGFAATIGAISFCIVCLQIKDNGIRSVIACNEPRHHTVALPKMNTSDYQGEEAVSYNTSAATQLVEALPPLPVDEQARVFKRGR